MNQHATCRHKTYRLSCEAFDAILDRAGHACQVCGANSTRLHIDHDHESRWVRGVLCAKCNAHLARVDKGQHQGDERTAAYLASAAGVGRFGQTHAVSVRISDADWGAFRALAEEAGSSASAEVVAFIRRYNRRHAPKETTTP